MRITSLLFFYIALTTFAHGQACLSGGITFATQADIDNFSTNYSGCTEILGFVSIVESSNGAINNLNGLHPLTKIHGSLDIRFIDNITSLNGLGSLDSIGGNCLIHFNQSLQSLSGFDNLISIGGNFEILENPSLQSVSGLGQLVTVGGDFEIIDNDALVTLGGLGSITSIGEDLWISSNANLSFLTGLESLTSIGQLLRLNSNPALTSLSGLDNLTTCGTISFIGNPALASLDGLQNLSSINGSIALVFNASLNSISDLSSVTSINGIININNNASLASLQGLENIDPLTINATSNTATDIFITNNALLTTCEVQTICDALDLSTTITDIQNNAPNCNSEAEVQAACDALLPVTWSTPLTAALRRNAVHLHWSVSRQNNNEAFWIEWSRNGREFKELGFMLGQGDYHLEKDYSYQHKHPTDGDNYYRIRQVDFNDAYSISNTAHVNLNSRYFALSPNPVQSLLTVLSSHPDKGRVTNAQGLVLLEFDIAQEESNIDVSALPKGVYFLETDSGHAEKLIKY